MSRLLRPWQAILGSLRSSQVHGRPPRRARRRSRPLCLALEQLEDRTVPSVFTVAHPDDSALRSLRQAILDANANPGADVIVFDAAARGTIGLTSGQLNIIDDLTITGPGADMLTVSGNHTSRVFTVGPGETVVISGL